jgi:hypothetical protein
MTNATPRKISVTMRHDGQPIAAAEPGSTIVLDLQLQRTKASALRYRWDPGAAELVATDAASATVKLPPGPGETVALVEIVDDNGGLLSGSIAIPLQTAPAPDSAAKLKSNTESASADRSGPVFKILTDNGML